MPYKDKIKEKEYKKEYYQKNKENKKEYYQKNKDKIKAYSKEYWFRNKEKISRKHKKYRKNNLKRINELKRKRKKMQDPAYFLMERLRKLLTKSFKKYSTLGKQTTSKLYGIDFNSIIEYLKPFPKNMKNYEIDHIIPLSWFDFNNPKEIKWAFAPENHQWLTIKENNRKGNRYILIKE